jgi:hypothetical protein
MHEMDCDPAGFEWIDIQDWENSTVVVLRKAKSTPAKVVIVCNFTPTPRLNHRVGVPCSGFWKEELNSDAELYAGSGQGNQGGREAEAVPWHGHPYSIEMVLPPLGVVFFSNPCPAEEAAEETEGRTQPRPESMPLPQDIPASRTASSGDIEHTPGSAPIGGHRDDAEGSGKEFPQGQQEDQPAESGKDKDDKKDPDKKSGGKKSGK